MNPLLALLSASLDQAFQFPACFLVSGFVMRRGRNEPFDLFDAGTMLVVLFCVGFLVRRMYLSPVRSLGGIGVTYRLPAHTVGPTVSWAHFLWDGIWIWFGSAMWTMSVATPDGPVEQPGFGTGIVIVTSLLVLARLFCLYHHRDSPDRI